MSGRIRTIKPELLDDDLTAALTHEAFRAFVSMFLLADDYGNLRANPKYLDGHIFWARESDTNVSRIIRELVENGLAVQYSVRGQDYLHLSGWDKHQRVDKPGKPRVPKPEEAENAIPEPVANDSGTIPEPVAPDHDHDPEGDQRPTTTTGPQPCPRDLLLTKEQVASLRTMPEVPDWAIELLTAEFRTNAQADPNDRRPLVVWRKCLAKMISARWLDPNKRPKKPAPSEQEVRDANRRKRESESRRAAEVQQRLASSVTPEETESLKLSIEGAWK